ncbi:hypothetical protein ACVWXM_007866 [Bradyrhizobium sp. GM7.3]
MDRDVRRLGVIAQLLLPRVDLRGVTIPGNLCLCPFSRHAIEGQLVRRKTGDSPRETAAAALLAGFLVNIF